MQLFYISDSFHALMLSLFTVELSTFLLIVQLLQIIYKRMNLNCNQPLASNNVPVILD